MKKILLLLIFLCGFYVQEYARTSLVLNNAATIVSLNYEGCEASIRIDGSTGQNPSNWPAGAQYPLFTETDLETGDTVSSMEQKVSNDKAPQYTISVAGSDGVYTQVVDRSANTSTGTAEAPIVDEFDEVTARYVKIDISAYSGEENYLTLSEFRVFSEIITSVGEKLSRQLDVVLYPNPVSEILTVFGVEDKAGIEVYSLLGTKVFQDQDVSFPYSVDMSGCKPGIYIVTVISEGDCSSAKVIKE